MSSVDVDATAFRDASVRCDDSLSCDVSDLKNLTFFAPSLGTCASTTANWKNDLTKLLNVDLYV